MKSMYGKVDETATEHKESLNLVEDCQVPVNYQVRCTSGF